MSELERGTVKFFDSRDNKRYGFIVTSSGEEIFFHFNDGEGTWLSGSEYGFDIDQVPPRDPRKGDEVIYFRVPGRKGPKASPWGFVPRQKSDLWAHQNLVDPDKLHEFPFLYDLIWRIPGVPLDGKFTVYSAKLGDSLLKQLGVDRFMTGERVFYFALVKKSAMEWEIHLLDSEHWFPDGIEEGITPADPIGIQIERLGIAETLTAVAEVDVSAYGGEWRTVFDEDDYEIPYAWGRERPEQRKVVIIYLR